MLHSLTTLAEADQKHLIFVFEQQIRKQQAQRTLPSSDAW